MKLSRQVIRLSILIFIILFLGTLGYMLIEGWTLIDSLYMVVITMTTVGFGEVQPLSQAGRLFTIALMFSGIGVVAYVFSSFFEYIFTGDFAGTLRRRRVSQEIDKLDNHIVICGYGRVGRSAVSSLKESGRKIVVIEVKDNLVQAAREDGLLVLEGDATHDEVLIQAGIERAWGLIVCTGQDSLNLFIVLSARSLNKDLYIVVRGIDAENEGKMRRAGADRVVSPYQIGGKHMANIIIRPHVTDFFDVVTLEGGIELWIEELHIEKDSELIGQTVVDADIRKRTGVTLVALIPSSGGDALIPDATTILNFRDELIVLGTRDQLAKLEELTGS
ncbi:MAG: potassium channel protein [Chloroflexota bacterium]